MSPTVLITAAATPASLSSVTHSVAGRRRQPGFERALERVAVGDAVGIGGEARVADELGQADDLGQARELHVARRGDREVAVARADHLVGRDVRVRVAERARLDPADQVVHRLVGEQRSARLGERDLDAVALAGLLGAPQRGQHADDAVEAGRQVGDRDARLDAGVGIRAGDGEDPRVRLHDEVERRPRGPRAAVAVARDDAVHEPRIPG